VVVSNGQAGGRTLLRRLKQIVDAIAVDLKILEGDFNACCAFRILLDLLAAAVDGAEETRDNAAVGKRFPSAHRVCFAGTSAAVRENWKVESIEEVFYCRRD
jgi:pyruvate-formate lyase-activating enzyme